MSQPVSLQVPQRWVPIFQRAYAGSRPAAIKAKCIDCKGFSSVPPCEAKECALFPPVKYKAKAVKTYCLWCMNCEAMPRRREGIKRIRECSSEKCPLFAVRPYQVAPESQEVPDIEGIRTSEPRKALHHVPTAFTLILALFLATVPIFAATGTASWYSTASCQREGTSGTVTASGAKFDENAMTCASWFYNFGTRLLVTNLANGKTVEVIVTDRGPNKKLVAKGRIIDLSRGAFQKIGDLRQGVLKVSVKLQDGGK